MSTLNLDTLADETPEEAPGGPRAPDEGKSEPLTAIYNVPVHVQVVLGRTAMPVSQLLKLGRGAVVELDRKVGEAVEILVNHRLVARGEVVIVEDQKLGVTLTEIVRADMGVE